MKISRRSIINYILLFLIVITSCRHKTKDAADTEKILSTPTSGDVTIYVDESFYPFIKSAKEVFEHLYRDAHLDIHYVTESEAVKSFLSKESPVTILSRRVSETELTDFNKRGYNIQELIFANDAIAFVVNRNNPDSILTFNEMKKIISGDYKTWNKISSSNIGDISLVFDKNNSSTATFLIDSILNKNPLPLNCYAASTNDDVLKYVRANRNAIGVIALNWISDNQDPKVTAALQGLSIIAVSSKKDETEFYKPEADNIAINKYPFRRNIYFINAEGRNGLGTGFASFLASDKGQTLIRQFELLPVNDPVRTITIRKTFEK